MIHVRCWQDISYGMDVLMREVTAVTQIANLLKRFVDEESRLQACGVDEAVVRITGMAVQP